VKRTPPQSASAREASVLVSALQQRLVSGLEAINQAPLSRIEWLRDNGSHGGGERYVARSTEAFNRASVNTSAVHYDADPKRKLGSATALSAIVHPAPPHAPSVHIHVSWTEMKDGASYWRMMADLNPAIANGAHASQFATALSQAAPAQYANAAREGDRYFDIPALGRRRGVTHFYLEGYRSQSLEADAALAVSIGESAIDAYLDILGDAFANEKTPSAEDRAAQLAYHTLYFFQVLTLDRGTTSGLLVHNQNDLGILGSLPSHVDRDLLLSWRDRAPRPQDLLVDGLLGALEKKVPTPVTDAVKTRLADVVRAHYRSHPNALELQASGSIVPPTVDNHGS